MISTKNLKKIVGLALVACLALALVACGSPSNSSSNSGGSSTSSSNDKTIIVGASPAPHAEILAQIKDTLADEGYTLEVIEYSDYIQPNVALDNGTLDANYFQHITYLVDYNEENKGKLEHELVSAAGIHFEPLGLYAGKTASLEALQNGAQIAVPSDPTNEARALLLLEAQGLITLKEGASITATTNDIVANPKNLVIKEVEAAALPRTLEDVDLAVINGNYAISAGLDPQDVIAAEDVDSEAAEVYVNVVAVRGGDESEPKIQALVKALKSDKVKEFIDTTYNGAVVFVA